MVIEVLWNQQPYVTYILKNVSILTKFKRMSRQLLTDKLPQTCLLGLYETLNLLKEIGFQLGVSFLN